MDDQKGMRKGSSGMEKKINEELNSDLIGINCSATLAEKTDES